MHTTSTELTLLRYRDLLRMGIVANRTTLRRWMSRENDPFPRPLKLGDGPSAIVAWRQSDVSAWLDRRIAPTPESHGETI